MSKDQKNLKLELYHDSLAKRIYDKASRQEKMRLQLERLVKDRFSLFNSQFNVFLSKEELALVSNYVDLSTLDKEVADYVHISKEASEKQEKAELEKLKAQNELLEKTRKTQRWFNRLLLVFLMATFGFIVFFGWYYIQAKGLYVANLFNISELKIRDNNHRVAIDSLTEIINLPGIYNWTRQARNAKYRAFEARYRAYTLWEAVDTVSLNFGADDVIYNKDFRKYLYFQENKLQHLNTLINWSDPSLLPYYYIEKGRLEKELFVKMGNGKKVYDFTKTFKMDEDPDFPLNKSADLYRLTDYFQAAVKDFLEALGNAAIPTAIEDEELYDDSAYDEQGFLIIDTLLTSITRDKCLDELSQLYLLKGDTVEFERLVRTIINKNPDKVKIYDLDWFARYLQSVNKYGEATQQISNLIDLVPVERKSEYYSYLADIYYKMGDKDRAILALENAKRIALSHQGEVGYYDQKIQSVNEDSDMELARLGVVGGVEVSPEYPGEDGKPKVDITFGNYRIQVTKYPNGLSELGDMGIDNFLESHISFLLDTLRLDTSAIDVVRSIVSGEGSSNSVLTYTEGFLSYGVFFWSLGVKSGKGELPALLKRFKRRFPELFENYFGVYGLDISDDTNDTYGYLVLNGKTINSDLLKEQFRSAEWLARFWLAGKDPKMFAVQVEHAISRLRFFYWVANKVQKKSISELINSEYGVALLLDQHINRPGYLVPCLEKAIRETGLRDPDNWTEREENQVLATYVKIRESYGKSPMVDAGRRAAIIKRYAESGVLSTSRNSFKFVPR